MSNCVLLWILACKAGHYGKNCTCHCSSNCNSTCEYIDKSCINCKEGWKRHCSKGNYKMTYEKSLFINISLSESKYMSLFYLNVYSEFFITHGFNLKCSVEFYFFFGLCFKIMNAIFEKNN